MIDLSQLKLAFLAGTLGQGGAERQLFYILQTLAHLGAEVRLFCLTKDEFWEERIQNLGIPVTWIGQQEYRIIRLYRLINELRRDKPIILQSQHSFTDLYVTAAARFLGIREIGAIRSDGLKDFSTSGSILGALSLRMTRLLAVNSHAACTRLLNAGITESKLHFLPNVLDTTLFTPPEHERTNQKFVVLGVGSLSKAKRFDRFLRVVAALQLLSPIPVESVIVGEGVMLNTLKNYAASLGLSNDTVRFQGVLDDVIPIYHHANVLLHTADWEGTPNVILEAMACGIPVVSTNVGDIPRIVQHGETGFLSHPHEEDLLIEYILKIINNQSLSVQMQE
ncbi:glycosyltransferase, partial [Patescibacteria group bacterium]|nr:glycosyltransferase [Patescibacteria group bacterium]